MKKIFLLSCIIIASITSSCNNDDEAGNININCTEVFVYGLNITIKDAQTDAILTEGITVTATEGDYSETLTQSNNIFIGAGERAGTYAVTASGAGYVSQTMNNIVVAEDQCHVIPEEVTLALDPN
ncbi:MAG: carboxypeptidase-like regulatory domain-containing protein [Patiriisocius sp.]|uniref:carboxypeptidase-like regulatory domain-containing protein n=1 Tax=Patiriisocius sp. TaxID=2822396 RepID=UPI003EF8561E